MFQQISIALALTVATLTTGVLAPAPAWSQAGGQLQKVEKRLTEKQVAAEKHQKQMEAIKDPDALSIEMRRHAQMTEEILALMLERQKLIEAKPQPAEAKKKQAKAKKKQAARKAAAPPGAGRGMPGGIMGGGMQGEHAMMGGEMGGMSPGAMMKQEMGAMPGPGMTGGAATQPRAGAPAIPAHPGAMPGGAGERAMEHEMGGGAAAKAPGSTTPGVPAQPGALESEMGGMGAGAVGGIQMEQEMGGMRGGATATPPSPAATAAPVQPGALESEMGGMGAGGDGGMRMGGMSGGGMSGGAAGTQPTPVAPIATPPSAEMEQVMKRIAAHSAYMETIQDQALLVQEMLRHQRMLDQMLMLMQK